MMVNIQKYVPPRALSAYVNYFWSLDVKGSKPCPKLLNIFADQCPRLIIQCFEGDGGIIKADGCKLPNNFISGIKSRKFSYTLEGKYSHIAVSFSPDALKKLFKIDTDIFTDNCMSLSHFFPKNVLTDLLEKIMAADNHLKRIAILSQYLLQKAEEIKKEDYLVSDFLSNGAKTEYRQLLKNYQIGERQFERRFYASVGVSPSTYKKLFRFNKAMGLLRSHSFEKLSDVAYSSHYADQSHFSREFKFYTGFTPKEFIYREKLVDEGNFIITA